MFQLGADRFPGCILCILAWVSPLSRGLATLHLISEHTMTPFLQRPPAFILLACCSLFGCVTDPGHMDPPGPEAPSDVEEPQGEITVTEAYDRRRIHGWPVLVNPRLMDDPELERRTLELLSDHLYRITRAVPSPALSRLQEVEIWVEEDTPWTQCMCYHVSPEWLVSNGYNPEKAGAIEVGNAKAFLDWTHSQPWMVLHELAHAYHFQVLGRDNPDVIAAWQEQVNAGVYEDVLHISGQQRPHYALTNPTEYFAETTESYFGTNDFHPFVRAELKQADPAGYDLMVSTWMGQTN